nr:MAG TPA: hypothetical protein [Bacteriophage sp.]
MRDSTIGSKVFILRTTIKVVLAGNFISPEFFIV